MSVTKFKFVLFDLDGTLVDSPLNFPAIKADLGIAEDADILTYLDELKRSSPKDHIQAEKIVYDHEYKAAQGVMVFKGVTNFLNFLRENNIEMGIVTRNCSPVAKKQLETIAEYFLDILTRDDVDKFKPHPESFEYYRDQHGFEADKTLFIGNHFHDQEFAENCQLAYLEFVADLNLDQRSYVFDSYEELAKNFIKYCPKEDH